ncbi:hypothetical protein [Leptotrichia trevisanii]|uniref:Uncharacterized protein n=1 Tax=Leptotrichia trevisanii TaxID=109328 RepID=A0A510K343_9FUSO|nr:hypothetical protein [Leptotrichia trevisanii]BBM46088.1 hypothetical protein JMUB3870_2215 [Leptotrichia trevisanii]
MNKIIIYFLFLSMFVLGNNNIIWQDVKEYENISKNEVFSIKVIDFRNRKNIKTNNINDKIITLQEMSSSESWEYVGILNIYYYRDGTLKLEIPEDIEQKNMIKINTEYKKILSPSIKNVLENSFQQANISEYMQDLNIKYINYEFSEINNQSSKINLKELCKKEEMIKKYQKNNNGKIPLSIPIKSKYEIQKDITLYDITYNNHNFIIYDNENNFKDKKLLTFIQTIKDIIEKLRKENSLYIDNENAIYNF